jgi:hypothetical protein
MNILNAVSQELADIPGIALGLLGFLVLTGFSLLGLVFIGVIHVIDMIIQIREGVKEAMVKEAWMKSLQAANSRYGVNLSENDGIILMQLPQDKPGFVFPWSKQITYKGPFGDNTINVVQNGNVVSNVSLENNNGDWVLKTNGVELTRVA